MSEKKPSSGISAWVSMVIIIRVAIMMALWLALFLMIFLGYFTIPVLLIAIVVGVYVLSDLGMLMVVRRRREALQRRRVALDQPSEEKEVQS